MENGASVEAVGIPVRGPLHSGSDASAEPLRGLSPPRWAHSLAGPVTKEFEVSFSRSDARFRVRVRHGSDAGLVSVELDDARSLGRGDFEFAAGRMLTQGFAALQVTGTPHAVRVWTFLPGIHDPLGPGVDRYRVFNVARHRSFCEMFGEHAVCTGMLPTASCVGHGSGELAIHVLGSARAGEPVENPRQIPAFAYSPKYGPRPPCFARATRATVGGRPLLLVGGTASVRGEDSVHASSREVQLEETLMNLRAVVDRARGGPGRPDLMLRGVVATRVYCKWPEELAWWTARLPPDLCRGADVDCLHGEICRQELLVEVETVVDLSVS